ncbi:glycosyltransferase family 2 protein [Sulfuricurvum sp.]|uniref:glycosyltransferase family 2 protein n=1 Tax=Sulfuricurvum sp. TaxID=2025608 RepID=UPI0026116D5C|nr:glycosyltransferase family 2 protein [Sulfuricurvum sp.]MDD2780908.1 glycosyltransferase family 2 protein [Sulfuricurvum sp.]
MAAAAVVVLYNPDNIVIDNINTYINDVEIVFVVDNSDQKKISIIKNLLKNSKIYYIDNHGNQGIANALNIGSKNAINMGYKWLLTMDQDSKITQDMLLKMTHYIQTHTASEISIISPFHANKFQQNSSTKELYSTILTTMTSGNLLNLDVFQQIGGFTENLFIDYVDNEYCLRSNLLKFKVIRINHAILEHNLGNLKQHQIFWKKFFSTNHSPIRRYYSFRNRLKIIELYQNNFPTYCQFEKSRFFVDIIIVLLYEKERCSKFKMMLRGYLDYKRGIFGKYHD